MSDGGPRQSLLGNLLLSAGVTLSLAALLEAVARFVETPGPRRAEYLWDWQAQWEDDFYTLASADPGWPPGEEFNRDGLRDRAHPLEKPEDTRRLAILGDSVTLGAGVEPNEAYPQVMQARLDAEGRRLEVFNVALWGWTTRQQRYAYERLARKYRPDQVLLGVCLNDIPEMKNNLSRPPELIAALHQRSALVRRLVDAPGREIRSVEELFLDKDAKKVRDGFELFFAEVRALREAVRADGATLSLLVFPFRFQLQRGAPPPTVQAEIAAFCAREGLRCLDLLPALRSAGEAAFLDYDHLSPAGAVRVAEEILGSGLVAAGPRADEVLKGRGGRPGLTAALRDADARVRAAAAWKLGRMGAEAKEAAAVLARCLEDESEAVRAAAAQALAAMGAQARPALPALLRALGDARQAVRWEAAQALSRIGLGPAEAASLDAALQSEDSYVRAFAAWTLGEMGPAAGKAAVPGLVAALQGGGGAGRAGAAAALAKLGSGAGDAVPALAAELRHPKEARRWRAARTLGKIGPQAAPAVPALAAALRDASQPVRAQAARALGRIGAGAAAAIPALLEAMKDADGEVRLEAVRALSKIPGR